MELIVLVTDVLAKQREAGGCRRRVGGFEWRSRRASSTGTRKLDPSARYELLGGGDLR
jgi:hypothetical protein